MTLRKEIRSLLGTRSKLLTPMLVWVLLVQLLSAQSGPPLDPCDANPVTCAPKIEIDQCSLPQTIADMGIVASPSESAWDPDYYPIAALGQPKELKQLLFPSGSGYYGYRPCHRFLVDLLVMPRSYHSNPDSAHDTVAWNAGAWDLPSSGQNEMTFPPLLHNFVNKPEVGFGDAYQDGAPHGSTSVPINADDCQRYHEYVTIYSATANNLTHPFDGLHWNPIYYRHQVGSWVFGLPPYNGQCEIQCQSSFPNGNCSPPEDITFPNADQNAPAIAYRFAIGTLLRTSWQQTALVLWEGSAATH